MSDSRFLLSTQDNPHSPFSNWTSWYMMDIQLGYDTCGLLARLSSSSEDVDDESTFATMREIVTDNFSGVHIMVTPEYYEET